MIATIKYGTGNELTREFSEGTTLGSVLTDPVIKAALGYGSNVEGHIGGVPQPNTTTLREAMTVSVHDKACTKA